MTETLNEDYELPPCPECQDNGGVFETMDALDDAKYWCMICGTTF